MGKGSRNRAMSKSTAVKTVKEERSLGVIITSVICAIALIAVVAYAMFIKSDLHLGSKAAMQVGDTKISALEFRYHYWRTINNFYNQNAFYIYYGLYHIDFQKSLTSQTCDLDTSKSWADYFADKTVETLTSLYCLKDDAEKNNFSMTDEQKDQMQADLSELRDSIKEGGTYKSLNEYLKAAYNTSEKNFLNYNELSYLVSAYNDHILDGYTYTDLEIRKHYEDNKADYDSIDYRYYLFTYPTESATTSATEAATNAATEAATTAATEAPTEQATDTSKVAKLKLEAKENADKMAAAVTDSDSFADYIYNNVLTEEQRKDYDKASSLIEDSVYNGVRASSNEEVAKWLTSGDRKIGDVQVFDISGKGYAVVMYLDCSLDTYNMVNVRHILIQTETVDKIYTTESPTEVDEELTNKAQEESDAKKLAEAERILKEFNDGDKTEDAFARLANTYSEDPGSNKNGGLYENIYKGQMRAEFEEWCFDEARKPGDVGIVKTANGYHVMYFVSDAEPYWSYRITNELKNEAYDEYLENLKKQYEVTTDKSVIDLIVK